jgi:hypothetical protein
MAWSRHKKTVLHVGIWFDHRPKKRLQKAGKPGTTRRARLKPEANTTGARFARRPQKAQQKKGEPKLP